MRVIPVLVLIAMLPIAAAATSVHIEWDVGNPVDGERRYVEHFPSSNVVTYCVETTEDDIITMVAIQRSNRLFMAR